MVPRFTWKVLKIKKEKKERKKERKEQRKKEDSLEAQTAGCQKTLKPIKMANFTVTKTQSTRKPSPEVAPTTSATVFSCDLEL